MDTQPTPPNTVMPEAQSAGVRPEDLRAGEPLPQSAPEMAPAPGSTPTPLPPATSQVASPPPKLTADDVAAALAAVPAPTPPGVGAVPTPSTADDVDVIEPEWVAKAEDVVQKHQGDPYGEEEAIEDLQQDYLQKRYGHTVANPNADKNQKGA